MRTRKSYADYLPDDWTVLVLGAGMIVLTAVMTWLAVAGPACTIPCPAH